MQKNLSLEFSPLVRGKRLQLNNAFTLVELIVVITILAILGTIAFISLSGYSSQSRDAVRISDISTIKSSLELFNLDAGKYPIPTSGVDITYSGAVVWNQGTFGDSVYKNVSKLDKIPHDPTTDKEYTYSVTANKFEYQLGGIVEGDTVGMNNLLQSQANAGETTATAYIAGNYNGLMAKSNSGTTCSVLTIPSIITNDTTTSSDLQQIIINNRFVYRGNKNLPSSFKTSKFKYDGGFSFTPNNLVAYTDTGSCTALISTTSNAARVNLLKGLQNSYSGTTLKNEGDISKILALSIDTNSPSIETQKYASNYMNNIFGGNIPIGEETFTQNLDITSCKTILDTGGSTGNGVYTIDSDGSGGNAPFSTYCNMTDNGGGWMLLAIYPQSGSAYPASDGFPTGPTQSTNSYAYTWASGKTKDVYAIITRGLGDDLIYTGTGQTWSAAGNVYFGSANVNITLAGASSSDPSLINKYYFATILTSVWGIPLNNGCGNGISAIHLSNQGAQTSPNGANWTPYSNPYGSYRCGSAYNVGAYKLLVYVR